MEWVETTGRTIEEAKDAALDQLGVDEHDAEFEVIEDVKLGLFGRIRNDARVRARVRPAVPRAKDEQRDRRRRSGGRQSGGDTTGGNRGRTTRPRPKAEEAVVPDEGGAPEQNGGRAVDVSLQDQAAEAKAFLEGLVDRFGNDATVEVVEVDEETVELQVTGQDLGLLIGPKGQTLAAIQDLTRTAVQHRAGASHGRLLVDVAGYRQKRRAALEAFTLQQVERVRASGTRLVLEPMSPADRKVVHDTVNDIDGVRTASEGEEPYRRVVILPEDA